MTDTLTASLEDYLEAIFNILAEKQAVRAKDIARRLKVSNSSVTGALHALADRELIRYAPYDVISLTPAGKTAAADVVRRHEVLRDFFVNVLAVDGRDADEAACQMEHSIPKGILERFVRYAEFSEACPRGGAKWIAGFDHYCSRGGSYDECEKCLSSTLEAVRRKKSQAARKASVRARLAELAPGRKGKVLKVGLKGEKGLRIVEMGISPGAVVEVERIAPLGDPLEIKVKGYRLSLRKEEAEGIEVEML
jgi:DtxR family Mn-dependent transcriptional regulator